MSGTEYYSPGQVPQYYPEPAPQSGGTSTVAIVALVIAIIVAIFIIIIVYLFVSGGSSVNNIVSEYSTKFLDNTVAQTIDGSPNTIYVVNPGSPATGTTYNITLNIYTSITSYVYTGRTTLFWIDAIGVPTGTTINIVKGTGVTFAATTGPAQPGVVTPGTSALYMWYSATSNTSAVVQRLL